MWGIYFLGCTGLQTLGKAFLFDVWEMGEVNVFGVWKTGWGHNLYINKGVEVFPFVADSRPNR